MGQVRSKHDSHASARPRLPAALTPQRSAQRHQFDKAFPVLVSSDFGIVNGVGRNISPQGMFIETREPCSIGTQIRVTFSAETLGTEIVAVGEVRYQCFLNYTGGTGEHEGMRGMGIRFVQFEEPTSSAKAVATH